MLTERQLASAAAAASGPNRERQHDAAEDEENIVIDMTEEDEDDEEYFNRDEEPSYPHGTVRAFNNNNNNNSQLADANNHFLANSEEEFLKTDIHSKMANFEAGDLVWFDPNTLGYCIPGKVLEHFTELCILTVEGRAQPAARLSEPEAHNQALLRADEESQLEVYDLSDPLQIASLIPRAPFVDERGVSDLVDLEQLSLESIVWNLKLRNKKELVYTRCGLRVLVSVNPYKQLSNLYNLDQVNLYDSTTSNANNHKLPLVSCKSPSTANKSSQQLLRWLMLSGDQSKTTAYSSLEPHIFAMANEALKTLLVTGQDQCFLLLGESGSGKTECCKLLAQYLATVNKSPTNLVTEQILESIQVLESFGNAKTKLNDNASRFGKLLEIRFQMNTGFITSAKTNYLNLLDGSRIIGQSEGERNYHIFYELLAGLSSSDKEKYGLQNAEKYFYLNQGQCFELPSKEDGQDFRSLLSSMQVLGFEYQEQDAIFRILASVLHLGNIYFHRKVLTIRSNSSNRYAEQQPSAIEGVEIGSDNELRWISHLLQIQYEAVVQCLTIRNSDSAGLNQPKERIMVPLNIDQALDSRDAMARALYSYLFKWLVQRINAMTCAKHEQQHQQMMMSSVHHNLDQESIYLCQTSESLCEFQPDKLRATSTLGRSSSSTRHHKLATLSILDVFGFENLSENNFEQLCINSAAELLAYHTSRYLLRLEQAEYSRERLRWDPIYLYSHNINTSLSQLSNSEFYASSNSAPSGFNQSAASSVMQLLIRKPLGILALLDDECNFPKATDQSFIEKCNHNHTLNESYQRARTLTNQAEFGIKHFGLQSRLTWYQVDGFIEKNRDSLRPEIVELLLSSKMNVVRDIVRKLGSKSDIDGSTSNQRTLSRTHDGRYVSMKPRATSVAARFQETLQSSVALEAISCGSTSNDMQLASGLTRAQPWFVFCFQPNRWRVGPPKVASVFDVAYVEEQARALNLLELTQIRRSGYHVKLRYNDFVSQYKCLLTKKEFEKITVVDVKRQEPGENAKIVSKQSNKEEQRRAIREVCCGIISTRFPLANRAQYQCGLTKMFLSERFFQQMEQLRLDAYLRAVSLIQRLLRGWLARQEYLHKRAAAVLVQSWFRARVARRKYIYQLTLIVKVQRRWRHQLAKRRRMSYEIKRRTQRKQQLLELQAQQANLDHQFRFRWTRTGERTLDIPEDLAGLYRAQRSWRPIHHLGQLQELDLGELRLRERRRRRRHLGEPLSVPFLASASGANPEAMASLISQLETDEGHSLRDLLNAYYPMEVPQFGYSRLTITRSFSWPKLENAKRNRLLRLIKRDQQNSLSATDIESRFKFIEQQACTIYKLLLRYVDSDFKVEQGPRNEAQHDEEISLRLLKFKLLADYLMHLCIKEPLLRNELYLQLLSLSWQNPRPQSVENVWRFMAACLAVFAPTDRRLCSIMLRYAHEYCPNHLRRQALLQIARIILEPSAPTRAHGSCLLEYWAQRKMVTRIALQASCYMDDNSLNGPMECPEMNPYEASTTNYSSRTLVLVGSRTTAQQLATATLKARQLPSHNLNGWSVEIQHDGAQSELSCRLRGDQVVFDHIAKAETMPEFLKMIQAKIGDSKSKTHNRHQQAPPTEQENRYSATSSNRRSTASKRLSYRQSSDALNYAPRGSIYNVDTRIPNRGPPPTFNSALMLNKRRSMSMQELQMMQSPRHSNHYYGDSDIYCQHSLADNQYSLNSRIDSHRVDPPVDYELAQQYYRLAPRVDNQRRRSQTPTGSMSHYSARQHRMSIGNESRRSSNSHMNYATAAHTGDTGRLLAKNRAPMSNGQSMSNNERNNRHRRSSSSSSRPLMLRERPVNSGSQGAYATPSSLGYSQPLVGGKQKVDNIPHYVASSIVSDTSEAPSMASHVCGVKVPQHNDDLDQYLDDLFNPMLDDVDLDEFSDSKSMANSVRVERQNGLMGLCGDTKRLASALRGSESPIEIETETIDDTNRPTEPTLSPTFESLLDSLHQQTNDQETELKESPLDDAAKHSITTDKQIPLPPPPPSLSNPTGNHTDKKIAVEQSDSSKHAVNASQINLTGSVGKLKISSELKAKLEQLNTVSSSTFTTSTSTTSQDLPEASVGGIVQQATKSLMEVKRLSEQRRNLLESQLSAAGFDNPDSARSSTSEFSTGKVLAAKQQLAAAAGLALTQLVATSSLSSRLSMTNDNQSPKQLPEEVASPPEEANAERRCRQFKDEELGPQSRAAINQRQAFYQLSVSSDQLDKQLVDSNHNKETAESDAEKMSDNRASSRQLSAVKMSTSECNGSTSLTRSPQIESNLNEAGQNTAIGAMCEQLYSSTRQQQHQPITLLQRQQESLRRGRKLASEQHQWVSSSPDPSMERLRSRRREMATAAESDAMIRRAALAERNQVAEELYMSYSNVDWQIKIRKEFFMPSETYEAPLVVQLIFTQLVADVFNPRHWTRLNNKERAAIKSLMKDNAIGYAPSLPAIGQMLEVKLELIRMARSFGLYFTRAYPASNFALGQYTRRTSWSLSSSSMTESTTGDDEDDEEESSGKEPVYSTRLDEMERFARKLRKANNMGESPFDFVAIHHSGLRLVVVEGSSDDSATDNCGYKVLETLKYRDMVEVVLLSGHSLMVSMRNERKSWIINSEQAGPLATLLTCFLADYNSHILNNNSTTNNQSHRLQTTAKQDNQAKRGGSLRRQRRSTKNALLAGHDDHHGDHFKQRQAPDSVGKFHPPAHSNYDLAYAKPALPEPPASPTRTPKQAHNGRLGGPTRTHSPPARAAASLSAASPTVGLQLAHKPLPDTPDGFGQAPAPVHQQSPANGSHKQRSPTAAKQPLRESFLEDGQPLRQATDCCQLQQHHQQQLQLPPASCTSNINSQSHQPQATRQGDKKHSLWQSSLSRMSNKFALLAGSPRAQPPDDDARQQMDHQQKHQKHHANPMHLSPASSSLYAASQQHTTSISQIAMDAWIETKVNYETDLASNQIEASTHDFDAELHSPAGSQHAETLTSSTNCNSSDGSRRGETFGPTSDQATASQEADGRYSMLQFALYNFREAIEKYSLESRVSEAQVSPSDTSTLRGSLKLIESLRGRSNTTTNGYETVGRQGTRSVLAAANCQNSQPGATDWTWRELAEMVKFTKGTLKHSLLKLNSDHLEKRALECFNAMRQYMGDAELKQNEVECVYLLLMTCHNYPSLRDEVYCQLMKQTTNNRSEKPDSCLRGWRLFSIITAYFDCSSNLKPYLFKFLESNAFDKRRAYCSVSALCLENLRKTFKHGGRKNVPSVEEIAATSAGRNSKRQIYRLPGGTERVINTKSTTVVEDIIHEICTNMLLVTDPLEMLEFSLYCIADGDLHTMPLNRDEYILDVTTELIKSHQHYFLIFCRSIWYHPLRLDSRLYIEVIFNQIAPDYLEGLLLVLPALSSSHRHQHSINQQEVGLRLRSKLVKEVARIGALLHRASGTDSMPHKDQMKYLIPKPILTAMKHIQRAQQRTHSTPNNGSSTYGGTGLAPSSVGSLSRRQLTNDTLPRHQEESRSSGGELVMATSQMWTELVQCNWREMSAFDTLDAKAQFLDIVRHWPLFGSSFFAIKFIQKDLIQSVDFILALNRQGVHMIDVRSHETVHRYPFNEVISTRKVRSEDGALYLDLKCGNLMKRTIIRIRTDQAHEISRLIRQYINIELLRQKEHQHPNTGGDTSLLPSMVALE